MNTQTTSPATNQQQLPTAQAAKPKGQTEANKPAAVQPPAPESKRPEPPKTLRTDGPTLEEYVAAGYPAEKYPPEGYAVRVKPPLSYWRKEIVTNNFFVNGKSLAFEPLDGNRGVLALNPGNPTHALLIEALTKAANEQRGGICRSSQNEYETLKKSYPLTASSRSVTRSQEEKLRIAPRPGMQGKAFRPPAPKGISQPKPAVPAGTETAAPAAAPTDAVVDGVPQGPNPVPDFVPRLGRAGTANETSET